MRLAIDGADGRRFASAPAKNTFRSRQVNTSSSIPTGRQFRIISSGCARKTARTLRRALGLAPERQPE